jgi:hypothetical protein
MRKAPNSRAVTTIFARTSLLSCVFRFESKPLGTAEPSRMCIGIGATVSWPDEEAHNADENQEAASYHEPMPKLECLQQLNKSAHCFAFCPRSTGQLSIGLVRRNISPINPRTTRTAPATLSQCGYCSPERMLGRLR